ncbi:extracellular solute-binding protein [Paenibacillus alkaliterrae]|uniref:extracellular solute-binding protein n=1 Tax=Paenibacillus alkaliterrae TaxID=320909 RepID=UPI001F44833A|nr:extracellular solute-binding protein [Paenibacillus alkaliterrae]MCF2941630.1 extracellular solute-binding protein [Paenibacillus alkaliterrae]
MNRSLKCTMLNVLALIIVFTITACSGGNNESAGSASSNANTGQSASESTDEGNSPSVGKVDSLRMIMINDPWVETAKDFASLYEEETGIKVEVESYGYDQTHQKEVLLGTQKSDATDIIVLDSPWVGEFAEGGITADITDRVANSPELDWADYIPSFAKVVEWKGKKIGVPFAPYYTLLHYRKDLFEAEGIAPPKTIDELKAAAKHFTNNPKYPDFYGISLNNAKGAAAGQSWFEWSANFGGKYFESAYPGTTDAYADVTPLINSPAGIETANFFKDMLQYQPPGALNVAWDERLQNFAQGKVAMIVEWNVRTMAMADKDKSKIADQFATVLMPSKEGVTSVPPLGGWLMSINQYSKKQDAAWDFIKWINKKDIHKEFVKASATPARLSQLDDAELIAMFPWFDTVKASALQAFEDNRPRIPESFQIIDIVGNYSSQGLSGQMTMEEAMNKANEEVEMLLKQGGYTMK